MRDISSGSIVPLPSTSYILDYNYITLLAEKGLCLFVLVIQYFIKFDQEIVKNLSKSIFCSEPQPGKDNFLGHPVEKEITLIDPYLPYMQQMQQYRLFVSFHP